MFRNNSIPAEPSIIPNRNFSIILYNIFVFHDAKLRVIKIFLDGTHTMFFKIVKDFVTRNATVPH